MVLDLQWKSRMNHSLPAKVGLVFGWLKEATLILRGKPSNDQQWTPKFVFIEGILQPSQIPVLNLDL